MNYCAQNYHVNRLRVAKGGKWVDLTAYNAMFFPVDKQAALVTVVRHKDILAGLVSVREAFGTAQNEVLVSGIEYSISACGGSGSKIISGDYFHPFKTNVMVQGRKTGWYLIPMKGNLFTTRHLDDLLKVRQFGKIQGLQFCC